MVKEVKKQVPISTLITERNSVNRSFVTGGKKKIFEHHHMIRIFKRTELQHMTGVESGCKEKIK